MPWSAPALLLIIVLSLASCGGDDRPDAPKAATTRGSTAVYDYRPAPSVRDGLLTPAAASGAGVLAAAFAVDGEVDKRALKAVASSHDARLGWLLSDLLRFVVAPGDAEDDLVDAFARLTGTDPRRDPAFEQSAWLSITNHLIAWDLPAPPRYRQLKASVFTAVEPGWRPFFADENAAIDWRLVSWGGVPIDDRRSGDREPCPRGCIPALDDPKLTDAGAGDWYPDDRVIFGVVEGGEAVAFPKNIMEVHEMVNLTIGGRRIALPYCTLCGSAQAYFTDRIAGRSAPLVLRTSGLLARSNKVMYDLTTRSVLNTFSGEALSGELHDDRVKLDQTTVAVSTWGEWKSAHPQTRIVARDGGLGRDYPLDPLGGRDDNGPIFPIGPVDPRLPVQEQVVGVEPPGQKPVAFPADQVRAELASGRQVAVGAVELLADGGGFRARLRDGRKLATHQAFWFAWSQFHPDSIVWNPLIK